MEFILKFLIKMFAQMLFKLVRLEASIAIDKAHVDEVVDDAEEIRRQLNKPEITDEEKNKLIIDNLRKLASL